MFVDISDRVDMLDRVDIVNSVDQLQKFYKCLKGFKIFLKKSFIFLNFPESSCVRMRSDVHFSPISES